MTDDEQDFKDSVRRIVTNGAVADALYLVSKNVPFDVAFSLDAQTRLAWIIILGKQDGAKWNWESMSFEQ